jgi:RNA-binding protein YhbY
MVLVKLQMGKNGLTDEFIENLRKIFLKSENVRISVLKSATRNKEEIKKWSEEIVSKLGKMNVYCKYNVVGFTIAMRRVRKASKG